MKNRSPKKSLKQKLTIALSVVNALNMAAPIALPYVNVARNVRTEGGQTEPLADLARAFYGTAQAGSTYNVPPNSTVDVMNDGDTMNVINGGSGTVTIMYSGGVQDILSGGSGTVTYMFNGGLQIVNDGGNGTVTNMINGGKQEITSSGAGTIETMSNGTQTVSSGGTGSIISMTSGQQYINNGGTGTVSEMSGGAQTVKSGGKGTVSALNGGAQIVWNGGTSKDTTIKSGGKQTAEAGGILAGTQTVEAGGVASGGTLTGTQNVAGGGMAKDTTIENGGTQNVLNGGEATDITVSGTQNVSNGGTAEGTTISSGGKQNVSNGGTAKDTTIKNGGEQTAEEGGVLAGTQTVEAGGVASGGTLTGTQNVAGAAMYVTVSQGGTQNIASGGAATYTTVNQGGTQNVNSGGYENVTSIYSGGVQNVNSGGTAETTDIYNGGVQNVNSGGSAGTTIISAGGVQNVNDGGTTGNASIIGVQNINSGGTATGKIYNGGVQNVKSGGTANGTHIYNGGVQMAKAGGVLAGTQGIERGGVASGGTLTGEQFVHGGGSAEGVTVASGGTQKVENGGVASGGTVNSGGVQTISLGGIVTNAILNGGTQTVERGGKAENVTVNGGTQNIASGGVASGGTLNSGTQNIASGGQATGATLNGGTQNIASGGQATSTNVSGGTQSIASGGTATNTTLNGGTQSIASGGQATSATVAERGTQIISAGGTATNTRVLSGGTQNIKSGGVVSGGTVEKGAALAFENPEDVKDVSGDGGMIISQDGGVDGGTLIRGEHDVVSGVTVSGMTLQGGAQTLAAGGTAIATTIEPQATQTLAAGTPSTPGGVSEHITLDGGTLVVGDYAHAQIDEADGGVLRLLDEGLAVADFGSLDAGTADSFTITSAYARGDTVRLGLGDESKSSAPGKTLKIGTMDGYANFVVNTDLANNQSDQIEIGTVKNASKANTIKINYDPTLAKKQTVASTNTKVATVKSGTATFEGAKSTIGGVDYLPTVETKDGGKSWYITGVNKGAGEGTHHTLMGMTAGMAALSAGTAYINDATDGLGLMANTGKDGVSTFAKFGGGAIRQETGSHVDVKTWNAILALGHANKKERGTFEYGAFFEYGNGNYATHENDLRGDGSMYYTGGGVLAKWTAAHGFYVEGSFRAGTVHDDAKNVLHDDVNTYSYDTRANYFGAHLGVGKEFEVANGNSVDVYGKFFFNRRNGVTFETGGNHYDLDAVKSEILRVGARYTMKREKWNFYGGVAYEHEFGGEATGTVDGLAIRSAEIKGGSARLELGATMKPDKNSPWSLDLNVAGFAGKKQGVTGGVSVSFTF